MARIGDFDKDANLQGWFDETLANAPRGWFDKSEINGNNADTQTSAAAPTATRAHDRPLEWWLEAEKASWEEAAAASKGKRPAKDTKRSSPGGDWYAAFKSSREEVQKTSSTSSTSSTSPPRVDRIPMLPLDARSNVITLVPRESVHDSEVNLRTPRDWELLASWEHATWDKLAATTNRYASGQELYSSYCRLLSMETASAQRDAMLSYLERSSLERAAGIDERQEVFTKVVRPLMLVAGGALVAYGLSKRSSKPSSKRKVS